MDNASLCEKLELLSKLMEIHGENSFKASSYAKAAFQIERHPVPLEEMDPADISSIRGIGEAIAAKIIQWLASGRFQLLEDYLEKTPPGILELMQIKGLGPKKIHALWKDMGLESPGEVLYACYENRLTRYKGFGAKTQQNIQQAIEYQLANENRFLYQQLEALWQGLLSRWHTSPPGAYRLELSGEARRQCPVLESLDFVCSAPADLLLAWLSSDFRLSEQHTGKLLLQSSEGIPIRIRLCEEASFGHALLEATGPDTFVQQLRNRAEASDRSWPVTGEEPRLFEILGRPFVHPALRDLPGIADTPTPAAADSLLSLPQVRGLIHAHSTWSDGACSIRDMALEARRQGLEYMLITDHSQSAFYAQGLKPDQVRAQQEEIDRLNEELAPFRIFKGIESDILWTGELDYHEDLLASFDVVIASVHSILKMDEAKAMSRLLKAVANPFTRILGHPTGRLLLSRPGYPVDHRRLIDACLEHNVVLEINAHPRRLDLDWSWIPYAIQKGVLLSVNPDAHAPAGIRDIHYGVLAAQKGGLSAAGNLSSFSAEAFQAFAACKKVPG